VAAAARGETFIAEDAHSRLVEELIEEPVLMGAALAQERALSSNVNAERQGDKVIAVSRCGRFHAATLPTERSLPADLERPL
jgi:hypothetical protein